MLSFTPPTLAELRAYRALCLLGSAAVLGFTAFSTSLGTAADPLWLRLVVAALPLVLFAASFVSETARAEMPGLSYVLQFALVGWFVVVVVLNGLTGLAMMAGLCLLVGIGVTVGLGGLRSWATTFMLGYVLAALLALAALLDGPMAERIVFSGAAAFCAIALFIGGIVQVRTRSALRVEQQRHRSLFESVSDTLVVIDAHSQEVLHANRAYLSLTGFTLQHLRASTLADLLEGRSDEIRRDVQRGIEEGQVDLGERIYRRRDATTTPVQARLCRIDLPGRRLLYLIARDLSEETQSRQSLERARDEAQEMLKLRTAFLNNMSHELRTPLVSITGFVDLLEEDLDEEERAEILGSLRRSSHRLHETLNALLDIAQIDGGQFHLEPEPVELNDAVREAARLLVPSARDKGLEVRFQACEPARVFVDRAALHRVLLNLISNAIKFTEAGSVTLHVEADSHRVRVRIEDTGPGIEPEVLPRLFTPFRQVSEGIGRVHEGSGLGLTITKRLTDLMAGRIMVDSKPGEGTRVTIAFARTWASPEEAFESGRAAGRALTPDEAPEALTIEADLLTPLDDASIRPFAARPRALIVEDNADTARLIGRLLENHLDTERAENGEEALRLAASTWYDVLLIDIHLGAGMDGLTLLHRLRKMSAYAFVPAVAVTTYAAPGDGERFIAAGFDAYLPKPFTGKQLIAAMEKANVHRAQVAS